MNEYREVTTEEREQMWNVGVFDINGNLPFHPGYTGIHRKADGRFWDARREVFIEDPETVAVLTEYVADPEAYRAKALATVPRPAPEKPVRRGNLLTRYLRWVSSRVLLRL